MVVQNKDKTKKGHLPEDMMKDQRYLAAKTVSDVWICYPWEATYVVCSKCLCVLIDVVILMSTTSSLNLNRYNDQIEYPGLCYQNRSMNSPCQQKVDD